MSIIESQVVWDIEKLSELEKMLLAGKTMQECAEHFGVSKARVSKVKCTHLKHLKRGSFGKTLKLKTEAEAYTAELLQRFNRPTFRPRSELEAAFSKAFSRKKQNSKKIGKEFTVRMSDIEWNLKCPILGIDLDWFSENQQENSPSFDQVDPCKGYVPGNVVIMSWRANRIKNDGTVDEHLKIAEWMQLRAEA